MGYPMTYRRVINRNRLAEGGYQHEAHRSIAMTSEARERLETWRSVAESAYDELNRRIDQDNLIRGDLRRLEADTVDERTTAFHIATRTGIDVETVAAVLKEFIAW